MDFLERGEVKIAADPREQGKYEDTMTLEEQWEYHNKLGDFYRKHPKIEREDKRREYEICGFPDEAYFAPPETK